MRRDSFSYLSTIIVTRQLKEKQLLAKEFCETDLAEGEEKKCHKLM